MPLVRYAGPAAEASVDSLRFGKEQKYFIPDLKNVNEKVSSAAPEPSLGVPKP